MERVREGLKNPNVSYTNPGQLVGLPPLRPLSVQVLPELQANWDGLNPQKRIKDLPEARAGPHRPETAHQGRKI
jgi:hypothetical protein